MSTWVKTEALPVHHLLLCLTWDSAKKIMMGAIIVLARLMMASLPGPAYGIIRTWIKVCNIVEGKIIRLYR
ncbi:hypothetical protein DCCM_2145 [Desulfocucumis palustris]|uniref:Uncharacterized protein n=1 Tax=Desulfocucumis palustris TaxID=1898651 RepID=A0A2L2XA62_9FIRM|nr:hypothetical protein [Desulfocucumis palustris]GBF33048.1 hypothetical protein DCCM_2145 [Desulfocucumis palustris]